MATQGIRLLSRASRRTARSPFCSATAKTSPSSTAPRLGLGSSRTRTTTCTTGTALDPTSTASLRMDATFYSPVGRAWSAVSFRHQLRRHRHRRLRRLRRRRRPCRRMIAPTLHRVTPLGRSALCHTRPRPQRAGVRPTARASASMPPMLLPAWDPVLGARAPAAARTQRPSRATCIRTRLATPTWRGRARPAAFSVATRMVASASRSPAATLAHVIIRSS